MLLNGYYLLTAVLIFYFEVLHSFMYRWVTVFPSKGQSKLNYRKTLSVFLKKIKIQGLENFQIRKTLCT